MICLGFCKIVLKKEICYAVLFCLGQMDEVEEDRKEGHTPSPLVTNRAWYSY